MMMTRTENTFLLLNGNVCFTKSHFHQLTPWLIQVYVRLTGHFEALNIHISKPRHRLS